MWMSVRYMPVDGMSNDDKFFSTTRVRGGKVGQHLSMEFSSIPCQMGETQVSVSLWLLRALDYSTLANEARMRVFMKMGG